MFCRAGRWPGGRGGTGLQEVSTLLARQAWPDQGLAWRARPQRGSGRAHDAGGPQGIAGDPLTSVIGLISNPRGIGRRQILAQAAASPSPRLSVSWPERPGRPGRSAANVALAPRFRRRRASRRGRQAQKLIFRLGPKHAKLVGCSSRRGVCVPGLPQGNAICVACFGRHLVLRSPGDLARRLGLPVNSNAPLAPIVARAASRPPHRPHRH